MARQCTQPKRPRNATWFKEKLMLTEAQEAGWILDEEQLTFLADPENVVVGPSRVVKCYSCQGEGHMARQCTQPKRPRNATWFKEKLMLTEAQEAGWILDEEQLTFLADPGISVALVA
nr:retrovirus-related Pol polyprotein from transposon TNT 1-94 [Tanacetum cinerariifolium]